MKNGKTKLELKAPQYKSLNVSVLYDTRLSGKAKFILMYLLSKPKLWKGHIYDVQRWCTDGRSSISAGFKELIKAGYIEKKFTRDKVTGRIKDSYYLVKDEVDFSDMKIGDILKIINDEF